MLRVRVEKIQYVTPLVRKDWINLSLHSLNL